MLTFLRSNLVCPVLLCFAVFCTVAIPGNVQVLLSRIRNEIPNPQPNITDVEASSTNYEKMALAKARFDDAVKHPSPQIFLMNTINRSNSVQGLDLHATDLTIVSSECSLPIQRQAAGRSLRMQPRPASMQAGETFPAKRIVILEIDFRM